jgi:butyrate kinase
MHRILVINPGSTSTKIAVYEDDDLVFEEVIRYRPEELDIFETVMDQYRKRIEDIFEILARQGCQVSDFTAVIGRGGLLKPIESGVYEVNAKMISDLIGTGKIPHACNLGAPMAREIADIISVPAFIADPPVVDELCPLARLSGLPEISRTAVFHALNHKAVARRAAKAMGIRYEDGNFIVCHVGSGATIGAHRKGRVIDANNALDGEGPFTPERCGGLPLLGFVEMCYSGNLSLEDIKKKLVGRGGLMAYLGTNSAVEVERRIKEGDEYAALVYETMAYQIAKEVGAQATVLKGDIHAIIITGGVSYSEMLVEWIKARVEFIAPVMVYPGEDEMRALAEACLRALRREEEVKVYM